MSTAVAIRIIVWSAAKVAELARQWAARGSDSIIRFVNHKEVGEKVIIAPFTHGWGGVSATPVAGVFSTTLAEKAAVRYYDGCNGPYWADSFAYLPSEEGGGVLFTNGHDRAAGDGPSGGGTILTFHCWGEIGGIFRDTYETEQARLIAEAEAAKIAAKKEFGHAAYQRLADLYGAEAAQRIMSMVGPGRVDKYIEIRRRAEIMLRLKSPSHGAATRWRKAMREDNELSYGKDRKVAAVKRHWLALMELEKSFEDVVVQFAKDADVFMAALNDAVWAICPPRKK